MSLPCITVVWQVAVTFLLHFTPGKLKALHSQSFVAVCEFMFPTCDLLHEVYTIACVQDVMHAFITGSFQ